MKLKYIFVHGLCGWGQYDKIYRRMPYWGMRGGDLIAYLREKGYDACAASVAPKGSAWDRACELYAQLAGKVTDYGEEHSRRCGHPRFGRDFTGEPLINDFSEDTGLVLIGHSFGGVTVRLFAELLANGSPEERAAAGEGELSLLFKGGMGERVHAIVTLAAPTNGTTAYDLYLDESFDPKAVKTTVTERLFDKMMSLGTRMDRDEKADFDNAAYDMHIDNALALNERISTLKNAWYFAVPCRAEPENMETLFRKSARHMASYTGVTRGGFAVGDYWRENDGLVNTESAKAPIGAPAKDYDPASIQPGVWNVLPVFEGDHMSLQGGLVRKRDVRGFYSELLSVIDGLPRR